MREPATPQLSLWADAAGPDPAGHPTESAYWRGSLASRQRSRDEQKQLGQFMTPAPIARFWAQGQTDANKQKVFKATPCTS